ncbi:hypothetical protein ACC764_38715, partial [Rhizobium ruizarguesonis]
MNSKVITTDDEMASIV